MFFYWLYIGFLVLQWRLDNVPLALAMSYVLEIWQRFRNARTGLEVWTLALGVDIGGNLTPIGASANVVAYSYMERNYGKVGGSAG